MRTPAEARKARAEGVLGILPALEGADSLEGAIGRLHQLHEMGLALVQLVHFRPNGLGHIQTWPYTPGGLTEFGREVVRECNRLGIVIDLAHANPETIRDTLELSRAPVIFSHTGAFALGEADRNLRDPEIRAIAAAGGVIGIWPNGSLLPTVADMARHIRYVTDLGGMDAAGIGSDLRGMSAYSEGFGEEANFEAIAEALAEAGFDSDEVEGILGANFERVWEEVTAHLTADGQRTRSTAMNRPALPNMNPWPPAALLLALLTGCAGSEPAPTLDETFMAIVAEARDTAGSPGLSAAVAVNGELIWSGASGLADVENGVPATADSVYRIASISKPVAGTALMQLVDQGAVDLDAEVQTYFPAFPEKEFPITVRHLMTHTSGIRHYNPGEMDMKDHFDTIEAAIEIFKDDPLVFEPGTQYSYSSYAWNIVAGIVENVSGQSFDDYLQENVWGTGRDGGHVPGTPG